MLFCIFCGCLLIFNANKIYLPDYNETIIGLRGSPGIELVESVKRVDRSRF